MLTISRFSLFFISIFFLSASSFSQQQSKEELQKKTQSLLAEIEAIKRSLNETKAGKRKSLGDLKQVERKISMRNQVITNIKTEVWMVEREMLRTYREIDTLKKELDLLKDQYAQSIVYAYKNRSNYDFLNFLFSSNGFADAIKRMTYLKTYRNYRTKKADDITNANKLLLSKIESLKGKREEKQVAVGEQAKQMAELEKEKQEKDEVVREWSSKEKELNRIYANKERERKQIQAAIAAVIKRERDEAIRKEREAAAKRKAEEAKAVAEGKPVPAPKPAPTTTATTPTTRRAPSALESTPEGLIVSQKFEENKGRLPWPVDKGVITLHYGINKIPGKTKTVSVPSDGLSIETSVGAPVKAIFDGEVRSVFNVGGKQLVMVRHGKYFTTYGNLSGAKVSKGQMVTAGQVIGMAGVNDEGVGEVTLQLDTETSTINPEPWLRNR
ncbi:MAG: peptidoglycan DD-metalloendopeptidase family protein [Chitinophagaceae bacterium]|nr:peptidoglycan DD-metalloendopeptidase family protein [Chitinophagaceae bacterium]